MLFVNAFEVSAADDACVPRGVGRGRAAARRAARVPGPAHAPRRRPGSGCASSTSAAGRARSCTRGRRAPRDGGGGGGARLPVAPGAVPAGLAAREVGADEPLEVLVGLEVPADGLDGHLAVGVDRDELQPDLTEDRPAVAGADLGVQARAQDADRAVRQERRLVEPDVAVLDRPAVGRVRDRDPDVGAVASPMRAPCLSRRGV